MRRWSWPLPVADVLALVCPGAERVTIAGVERVKVSTLRLRSFVEHGVRCVACGREGSRFYLESTLKGELPHLNLYAVDPDGTEVLMTRDHVVALADGGLDEMGNLQTMCAPCNEAKDSEKQRRSKR